MQVHDLHLGSDPCPFDLKNAHAMTKTQNREHLEIIKRNVQITIGSVRLLS